MSDIKPMDPRMTKLGKNLSDVSGQFSTPMPMPSPLVETRGCGAATKGNKHEKSD